MKKISISLLMALFVFTNLIKAQDDAQKTFVLGLSFSPSVDWMSPSTEKYLSDGATIGYAYGIDMDFSIAHSPNYFIHTGLQLKRTGGKLSYNDTAEVSRSYKLDYIRIPAAFKLKTNQFGRFAFYGMFGLDFDIKVGAKASDEYRILSINKPNIKISDDIPLFRSGLLVGAGSEYTISGNTKAYAGIHFSNGFTDVLSRTNIYGVKENAMLKYVELTVGVLF